MNGHNGTPAPGRSGPIRVAIVDDHRMFLDGLTSWLRAATDSIVVTIAVTSWAEMMADPQLPVDVALLDLGLRDGPPPAVKIAVLKSAGIATVVVSTLPDPAQLRSCLTAGASSYLPKTEDAAAVVRAVTAAAAGEAYLSASLAEALLAVDDEQSPSLSPQELRALTLYASGLPLKSVARRLNVSYETAKGYLDRVRAKYASVGRGAQTKLELHQRAVEDGHLIHG